MAIRDAMFTAKQVGAIVAAVTAVSGGVGGIGGTLTAFSATDRAQVVVEERSKKNEDKTREIVEEMRLLKTEMRETARITDERIEKIATHTQASVDQIKALLLDMVRDRQKGR